MKYQRLEDLRTDHDLTIRQVADYLGCNRDVYTRYEKGVRQLPISIAIRLAELYQSVWIIWSASAMRSGRMDPDFPVSPPQQKQEDSFSSPCPPCLLFRLQILQIFHHPRFAEFPSVRLPPEIQRKMPARDSVFQVDAGIQFYNEEFFCFFFIYY